MSLHKFFRNPEARRLTFKFIIIFILGISIIYGSSIFLAKKINKTIVNQNTVVVAKILQGKTNASIFKSFYKLEPEEEIDEARKLLKTYGYDENLSISTNEVYSQIRKDMIIIYIPITVLFLCILYFSSLRELRRIYTELECIAENTRSMSHGKYKKITSNFSEGEVEILISCLNYMGERVNNSIDLLKKDKENLKDFLSDISHQLKTPLASLVMFNDLMRENPNIPYEDRIKFLDKSEEQLRRMEWLIMNLLKMGRLEANAINFEMEYQPLRDTINLAISPLQGQAQIKKQELIVDGDLDAVVFHDKEWLSEAISNIVKNAIEHTKEEGIIKINVEKGPLITKIKIVDNGPGISKEMQKKVFKRFYKGENSLNPNSIGIGLSLAKSIIEEQEGEIKLISEEGKGTTFIISFIKKI